MEDEEDDRESRAPSRPRGRTTLRHSHHSSPSHPRSTRLERQVDCQAARRPKGAARLWISLSEPYGMQSSLPPTRLRLATSTMVSEVVSSLALI